MFTEHNELSIELDGWFKGHAEGALAIGALLTIVLAIIVMISGRTWGKLGSGPTHDDFRTTVKTQLKLTSIIRFGFHKPPSITDS